MASISSLKMMQGDSFIKLKGIADKFHSIPNEHLDKLRACQLQTNGIRLSRTCMGHQINLVVSTDEGSHPYHEDWQHLENYSETPCRFLTNSSWCFYPLEQKNSYADSGEYSTTCWIQRWQRQQSESGCTHPEAGYNYESNVVFLSTWDVFSGGWPCMVLLKEWKGMRRK